jgi:trehalose 6-phosphate phosphatase
MAVTAAELHAGAPPPIPCTDQTALFVDLDGTLADFALTPEAVTLDLQLPPLLRALCTALGGAFAVISGRPLTAVDELLQWPQVVAAGQHGGELRLPNGSVERAAIDAAALDAARMLVHNLLPRMDDVRIEDKGIALAIHYREFPGSEPHARALAANALQAAGPGFELQHGSFVIELKSTRVDKGRALAALMTQTAFVGRRPWVLGDDYADEHAFAMAQTLGGAGVVVGSRTDSVAHHQLADPAAARAWLVQILRQHEATT